MARIREIWLAFSWVPLVVALMRKVIIIHHVRGMHHVCRAWHLGHVVVLMNEINFLALV